MNILGSGSGYSSTKRIYILISKCMWEYFNSIVYIFDRTSKATTFCILKLNRSQVVWNEVIRITVLIGLNFNFPTSFTVFLGKIFLSLRLLTSIGQNFGVLIYTKTNQILRLHEIWLSYVYRKKIFFFFHLFFWDVVNVNYIR